MPVRTPSPDGAVRGGWGRRGGAHTILRRAGLANALSLSLARALSQGVIERGQTLVSSLGTEYDDVTDALTDPKEREAAKAAKKRQLRAALVEPPPHPPARAPPRGTLASCSHSCTCTTTRMRGTHAHGRTRGWTKTHMAPAHTCLLRTGTGRGRGRQSRGHGGGGCQKG